jgi:hypothetical protein
MQSNNKVPAVIHNTDAMAPQKYHKAEYKNFIAASKDVVPLKQAIIESLLCIKCSSSIDRSIEKSCSLGLFDRMKKALFGTPLKVFL